MGLILKYVVQSDAGTFHYRRRFPKDVLEIVGKGEFKRLLGSSEREALKQYAKVHAEFERQVDDCRRRKPGVPQDATTLEIHKEAMRLAREMEKETIHLGGRALPANDPDAADVWRDSYIDRLPVDPETGEPIGGDPVIVRALGIMTSGGGLPKPKPTLMDAKRLYIKERIEGDINEAAKLTRIERAMRYLGNVIEPTRALAELTREDAREVRDHMLRDLQKNPSTVKRCITDIRAMVNLGIKEFDLAGVSNPFEKLEVKQVTVAKEERSPIPDEVLAAIRSRLVANAGSTIWNIWRIVEGTGCRLGEVTGLLVSDVVLDAPIPYIDLREHDHRRLKTAGSIRRVPLIGEALIAAQGAVKEANGSAFLFPRYGRIRGADSASATLMKHIRAVTEDKKIVVHSLRHTMEDRLIRARIDEFDRNLVLGHSSGGMSERYGGPEARLEAAERALRAAILLVGR